MKSVAFILAKGNSNRLPGKNKKKLLGKPLFLYTVEAALSSECYDLVVVSSEDDEIIEMASFYNVKTIKRKEELCTDDIRAKDVILEHLNEISQNFDYISLLMATSPLRTAEHIKASFELIKKHKAQTLVSVKKFDFHPEISFKILNDVLLPYRDECYEWKREDTFDDAFHPNGAIFTSTYYYFIRNQTFFSDDTIAFKMSQESSVDIDNIFDFRLAEIIIKEEKNEK